MRGAEVLVQRLQAAGVSHVSVLCGNGLGPFLSAAKRAGLRLADVRNEQAASYMADAYARLTGRVGVCAVSSGIAHANAIAGLLNARFDGAPVLLLTGACDSRNLGRGAFQDVDQVEMVRSVCRHVELVTRPERISPALDEAVAAATTGRPAPVHLTVSMDALVGDVDEAAEGPPVPSGEVRHHASGDADLVREAVRMIAAAERPIIVAGTGVFYARGGVALQRFAELTGAPIVTPIWDRGVVAAPSDFFLGVVGAMSGEPGLLESADLILLAGAQVDYRVRYMDRPPLRDDLRTIRVDVSPEALRQGIEADIGILGGPGTVFEQLAEAWQSGGEGQKADWLNQARECHTRFYERWARPPDMDQRPMIGAHVVHSLRAALTDETVFLVDGGNIGQWAHMVLCADRYPSNWLTCGASGVVGWGFPGACAARLAFPDRPVLLLSGDGAAAFGIAELESASRQRLPFVAVVADDRAWGIVVSGEKATQGFTTVSELGNVDYVNVAKGFGAYAVRAESPSEIVAEVQEGFRRQDKPTVVHVPIAVRAPTDRTRSLATT